MSALTTVTFTIIDTAITVVLLNGTATATTLCYCHNRTC